MGKTERDCGARFEREIGRLLGVRRNIRADYSESKPDLETDRLVAECKYRKGIAVCRWLEQAESYKPEGSGKIAVVFARERGGQAIAILRAVDFLELITGAGE